jgi:hypothetical protein
VRDATLIFDEYINKINQNLAFRDYYIADFHEEDQAKMDTMPNFSIIKADDNFDYYTNDAVDFYRLLDAPLVSERIHLNKRREQKRIQRENDHKKRDSLANDVSEKYRDTLQNIAFILKGNWEKNLNTKLTKLNLRPEDSLLTSTPYLAKFEVIKKNYRCIH